MVEWHTHTRDETILQYIDILQYLLLQYNTIRLKGNINILYIAIYVLWYIAMFVVHYTTKMTGPLVTWIIHLSFYAFTQLYRVYILFFTAKTHIYIWNVY